MSTTTAARVIVLPTFEPEGSSPGQRVNLDGRLAGATTRALLAGLGGVRVSRLIHIGENGLHLVGRGGLCALVLLGHALPHSVIRSHVAARGSKQSGFSIGRQLGLSLRSAGIPPKLHTRGWRGDAPPHLGVMAKLHAVVGGIGAAKRHELVVRATLHHATAVHGHDLVRVADGRETVGDHKRRAAGRQARERLLDGSLALVVECARGLVEHEDSFGFLRTRVPIAMRCFWPPESLAPRSPTCVS